MTHKKVLVVDDVVSTGDSLKALKMLADTSNANIVGEMAILGEGDSQQRQDIITLGDLPLFDADGNPK